MVKHPSPADEVASNDDLLVEILIHPPTKSLLRFKSVSKRWLALITSPHLSHRRYPHPCAPSGLFLLPLCGSSLRHLDLHPCTCSGLPPHPFNHHIPEVELILSDSHENLTDSPFRALTCFPGLLGVRILDSCNGLICCSCVVCEEDYNPTTKQFITLPEPGQGVRRNFDGLSLAFDPSKSPHYKVVCVWSIVLLNHEHFQIEIYSSETKFWRKSGELFTAYDTNFHGGVYWNGAINWVSFSGDSLYFNVDNDRLRTMAMLPIRDGQYERPFRYFRESHDHLHFIEIYFMT
ncbi:F-box protein At5g07610-like [Cornus florida]|uniref:F-box protein At5g07610-like n=1 Tax=Cornus florida TaxID=4283 RepID=UPI00289C6582|nr:F-box protein At5g07610-like [Cornus florida]